MVSVLTKPMKDIFKIPIRMTDRCGHNFCHACLVDIAGEENEWSCPECRTIQTKTVDGLTRPRFVERAVEKFKAQESETKAACKTHGMPFSLCKFSKKNDTIILFRYSSIR